MPRPSPQTDRVIALSRLLAAHPDEGFSMAEIARRLRLNKATLYPMMASLTDAGWLVRDPVAKTFRLGSELIALGEAAGRRLPATQLARPAMVELATGLGVTCAAFTASDGVATLTDQVWDIRSTLPPLRAGLWAPLRAPLGSVFAAWANDESIEQWLNGDKRDDHAEALRAIRERGYVVEMRTPASEPRGLGKLAELNIEPTGLLAGTLDPDGVYAVSTIEAPVFDADGRVELALVLVGLPRAMTGTQVDAMAGKLLSAIDRLSAAR